MITYSVSLQFGLTIAIALAFVPAILLALEIASAVILREPTLSTAVSHATRRIAAIIPACNEEVRLLLTLEDVKAQLPTSARLVVVADNCTDRTAEIAHAAGAEVTERHDPGRRGKGYALDWGVQYLKQDPPDVVLVIDADCRLGENTISILANISLSAERPIQALYIMKMPAGSLGKRGVEELAWILKTYVRPLGLLKLGLPCQLMGTGMAFPWKAISNVDLASGNLVEDVKLGLDLAAKGYAPQFCPSVYIESSFPTSEAAAIDQRRRWEIGSVRVLVTEGPRFVWRALTSGNLHLLVLALDAMIPPLGLLSGFIIILWLAAAAEAAMSYRFAHFVGATMVSTLVGGSLIVAWFRFGRQVLHPRDAWQLIRHLLQKFRIYRLRLGQPQKWNRTDRS